MRKGNSPKMGYTFKMQPFALIFVPNHFCSQPYISPASDRESLGLDFPLRARKARNSEESNASLLSQDANFRERGATVASMVH